MNWVGFIIKEERKALKITLEKLSAQSGLSKSFLSDVEQGRSDIGFEKLCRVAKALGMTIKFVKR